MKFKADESEVKLRGGYYTRPEIASFLLRWALGIAPRHLLEPSCGDGVFLARLATLLPADAPRPLARLPTVTAFEIDPAEAGKAQAAAERIPGAEVHVRDFLSWSLERLGGPPVFDAAVGNPPFIRYQYLSPESQEIAERIFRSLGLAFTRHVNAWVPFVAAALALLRPGGRLAMVLPAELLHVLHAQSLRTFLAGQCSRVLLFDPQELWFDGVLQGAVLLLAEKRELGTSEEPGRIAIIPTRAESFLDQDPEDLFRTADWAPLGGPVLSGKWMPALLSRREREVLTAAAGLPGVRRFAEVADVDIGIVTGANKFFLVSDGEVERHGLGAWAFPMFGRSEHVPGVIYDEETHVGNRRAGLPSNFLWFTREELADLPPAVRGYLERGAAEGLPERYKCRIRQPWYSVPSVYATSVGMLKRCHHFPRLISNRLGAFTTDTAYRVRAKETEPEDLVFSFVNSLTALCAELEGRHYGGGVLELVPSEIEKLLLPLPLEEPSPGGRLERLDQEIRTGTPAEELLRRQDDDLLAPVGLSSEEAGELRAAWSRLRSRRQRTDDDSRD
ncbi:MAG TPA: N-6 DNA methylase [Thermoanaerobaculia bacterium]|nr:N-6 DNA methylase [Thermoanaerobaculia bacterium]